MRMERPACPICNQLRALCSCQPREPQFDTRKLEINKQALKLKRMELAKQKLPDLSRFPLR